VRRIHGIIVQITTNGCRKGRGARQTSSSPRDFWKEKSKLKEGGLKTQIKSTSQKVFFWPEYSRRNSIRRGGGETQTDRQTGRVNATVFQIMSYE
jgi:hypothetical protein